MFRSARNALARFGGVMTWNFSQTDFAVLKVTCWNSVSRNGICKALAAQWIVDHAHGGALHNRVVDRRGNLSESAIRLITQNFISWRRAQKSAVPEFLIKRGVLPRQSSLDISRTFDRKVGKRNVEVTTVEHTTKPTDQTGGGAGCNVALELAQALRRVCGSYAMIDFGPVSGSGHSTAAWIGGPTYSSDGDACFFDPNVGEFYFEDKENFFKWFEVFYATSYQGFLCNFNGYWAVGQWALANGASKAG
jgi:YopT peptidase